MARNIGADYISPPISHDAAVAAGGETHLHKFGFFAPPSAASFRTAASHSHEDFGKKVSEVARAAAKSRFDSATKCDWQREEKRGEDRREPREEKRRTGQFPI